MAESVEQTQPPSEARNGARREDNNQLPPCSVVLRALREARGVTQDGWAAWLGLGRRTIQRWESGAAAPDAGTERQLITLCRERGLFRAYDHGPLRGLTVTPELLADLIAGARLSARPAPGAAAPVGTTPASPPAGLVAPPVLPSGTITYLFTDLEGSTRLWERFPDEMRLTMARHDALLGEIFGGNGGVVVRPRGEGDSLFVVFVRASEALAAVIAAQRAIAAEDWGVVGQLRVRMALHTGQAGLRDGDYYGPDVNRCARIRAAGHGEQILISHATALLVRQSLPAGAALIDLGSHRLKDLDAPEQIFQLTASGLRRDFPTLVTLDSRPTNLPRPATSFIGREQETEAIVRLLRGGARLVTLTGPGGTGKTRLALQAARELVTEFEHGVFFVDLAPVRDDGLIATAIVETLGLREAPGQSPLRVVEDYLQPKQLLLVLDNFEQIVSGARAIATLLAHCPTLTVLVTSRITLRLSGEREFPVPPLPVPDEGAIAETAALDQYAAVQLFEERAREASPNFAPSRADAAAIAAICARLDGLPLAIELAAARVRTLPPERLLERLQHRLWLLTHGPRDAPARQQTLRATIVWSYELLSVAERTAFARLAVFAGGCTLEAAEAVCGDAEGGALDAITSLQEQSLIQQVTLPGGEPRLRMLETIREFGLERLAESGEAATVRRRHAEYYLALAVRGGTAIRGPGRVEWMNRLQADVENIRAVLAWCVETGEAELGLRFIGTLEEWYRRRFAGEGLRWGEEMLALPGAEVRGALRAGALNTVAAVARAHGQAERARELATESATIWREVDGKAGLARALVMLGQLEFDRGANESAFDGAVAAARESGDPWTLAYSLCFKALTASPVNETPTRAILDEALAVATVQNDPSLLAVVLLAKGRFLLYHERFAEGAAELERALALVRAMGDRFNAFAVLLDLTIAMVEQADAPRALALCEELVLATRRDRIGTMPELTLDTVAGTLACSGEPLTAARLFGAAQNIRGGRPPRYTAAHAGAFVTRQTARVRAELGEERFLAAHAAGCLLPPEPALDEGLSLVQRLLDHLYMEPAALGATAAPAPHPEQ